MKTLTPLALALSAAIVAAGLGVTLWGVERRQQTIQAEAAQRFQRETQRIAREVAQRFDAPLQGLRGVTGLFAASDRVTRADFQHFLEASGLRSQYTGVRGFGFIRKVPQAEVDAFVRAQHADGAPDYTLRTLGPTRAEVRYIIQYLWPITNNRPAIGLDIASEPRRKEAADRAAATGEPTLTRPIVLAQDQQRTPGMLYLMPVYAQAGVAGGPPTGSARVSGWAYTPIVASELLTDVTASGGGLVDFSLAERGGAGNGGLAIYHSAQAAGGENAGRLGPAVPGQSGTDPGRPGPPTRHPQHARLRGWP